MEFFTDEVIRSLLASSLETAELGPDGFRDVGSGPGSAEANYIDWLTIADNAESVVDDVTDSETTFGSCLHRDLRVHLRREDGKAR
jgi:hypothetical protein